MTQQVTDWRGTPINVGDLVVYGAPVNRSIAMVEAEVVGFTKSGRVNLKVIRRAYGSWGDENPKIVHVGPDRLTIVESLPASTAPTEIEKAAERREKMRKHYITRIRELSRGDQPRGNWETVEYYRNRLDELL